MDDIKISVGDGILESSIEKSLKASLKDRDFFASVARSELKKLGVTEDLSLILLASYKSHHKYGYPVSMNTLRHLIELLHGRNDRSGSGGFKCRELPSSPFFLIKSAWLYDHAPYYFFYEEDKHEQRDALIFEFAHAFDRYIHARRKDIYSWKMLKKPKRVKYTTFWERKLFDPIDLIGKVIRDNLEGLEMSVDFHPFNYATLLPEEVFHEKRLEIREVCRRTGIKIDLHSPIVGPNYPVPDPTRGKQIFFNPIDCFSVQKDTLELANDIGAGAVVFHLVDRNNPEGMAAIVEKAGGTDVRATIENYCHLGCSMKSADFIECVDAIYERLSAAVRKKNFGITIDVGHLNIEGEDPLIGAEKIGRWCADRQVFIRVHATDNYGDLLFSPPAYSADVHSNVSGKGINNSLIIKLLRSMGHGFDVVAEQIKPLTPEDIQTIHGAQTYRLTRTFAEYCQLGRERLANLESMTFVSPEIAKEPACCFLAGLEGVDSLEEYLVYRRIQEKKHLSVDEAKRVSQDFIKMPEKLKADLRAYIDDLLLPIQCESGAIEKSELDLICQNISGVLYRTLGDKNLNLIFADERIYDSGEIVCRQDNPGREMYLVKEGEVSICIDGNCVAQLGRGEIFGEMSLFYNINRSATVKSEVKGTCIGILSRDRLEKLFISGKPSVRDLIYRLYKILPDRLRNLNDKYKAAVLALYLLSDEKDKGMFPDLDHVYMDVKFEKSGVLPTLTDEEIREIFCKVRQYDAGQTIFSEGDVGDAAYYIIQGTVKAVTSSASQKEILLGEIGQGCTFGEMALIDGKPRSADIMTVTPATLAVISIEQFEALIRKKTALSYRLMGFICLSLFKCILRLDKIYSDLKSAFEH